MLQPLQQLATRTRQQPVRHLLLRLRLRLVLVLLRRLLGESGAA